MEEQLDRLMQQLQDLEECRCTTEKFFKSTCVEAVYWTIKCACYSWQVVIHVRKYFFIFYIYSSIDIYMCVCVYNVSVSVSSFLCVFQRRTGWGRVWGDKKGNPGTAEWIQWFPEEDHDRRHDTCGWTQWNAAGMDNQWIMCSYCVYKGYRLQNKSIKIIQYKQWFVKCYKFFSNVFVFIRQSRLPSAKHSKPQRWSDFLPRNSQDSWEPD